jgi:hypothetical protein
MPQCSQSICWGTGSACACEPRAGSTWVHLVGRLSQGSARRNGGSTRRSLHYYDGQALHSVSGGSDKVGRIVFEIDVSREKHLPGDYELQAVRAYPHELDGWEDLVVEFGGKGEIGFRIAQEYGVPAPTVTGWKFD